MRVRQQCTGECSCIPLECVLTRLPIYALISMVISICMQGKNKLHNAYSLDLYTVTHITVHSTHNKASQLYVLCLTFLLTHKAACSVYSVTF